MKSGLARVTLQGSWGSKNHSLQLRTSPVKTASGPSLMIVQDVASTEAEI